MISDRVIPFWKTGFQNGESDLVANILNNGEISNGPQILEFEKELARFLGVKYVITTSSGSMALLASLWTLGVGPGDEVIVPNRTWIATAHAPFLLGAKVKLVDVENDRPIINIESLKSSITAKTKAIIPVHIGGRAADMRMINEVAKEGNIAVIEDAAQAFGSKNEYGFLGTQSLFGCFSLSVTKVISTGQGGFICTSSEDYYKKLQKIKTHGVDSIINPIWGNPGFNFKMPAILAGIGLRQLEQMPKRMKRLNEIYLKYIDGIKNSQYVKIIPVNLSNGELPVYIEAICSEREEFIHYMAANGIQCRPFSPDLSDATYFNGDGYFGKNSQIFATQGLYLPGGPEQGYEDIEMVIKVINNYKKMT